MNDDASIAEALQRHYASSGLPPDGGRSTREWSLMLGRLALPLDNFAWRKRALQHHDVHHLLTGYACTPAGELEMAAWEFAAGRFPHPLSTLFCLPLIGFGALTLPRRSFAAFVRGRRSRTLYAKPLTAHLLGLSVRELREQVLPRTAPAATPGDLVRYLALAGSSWSLIAVPILILWLLFLSRPG